MKARWKDKRIEELWRALQARFPDATLAEVPMPDKGVFDECLIYVLNAPVDPPWLVQEFAAKVMTRVWGDDIWPASVSAVSREDTARYYSHLVPKRPRAVAKTKRPRVAAKRRRAARAAN